MSFRLDNLWKGDGLNYSAFLAPDANIPVLRLDAATYAGSGNWYDSIGNKEFFWSKDAPPTYVGTGEKYFSFNALTSQYMQCYTSLPTMNVFTLEVWHYWNGVNSGDQPCLISEIFTGGSLNYAIGNLGGGITQGGYFNGGFQASPPFALTPNTWYQIVVTCDSSRLVKVYLNNTLISTQSTGGALPTSSNGGIRLMSRWDNLDCWGGRLGLVNIYNTALDSTAINTKLNANRSRFGL
jgi:hypothetical protein